MKYEKLEYSKSDVLDMQEDINRLMEIINKAIEYIKQNATYDKDLGKIYTKKELTLINILKGKDIL